jgi:putative ABC transport system permease protein
MAPVLAGVLIGVAGGFALARTMQSFVFGISSGDPLTFAAVALVLIGIAALACYVPARRATRVDPLVALRYE